MGTKQSKNQTLVNEYISFLEKRQRKVNLNEFHCLKYEKVVEIMRGWQNLGGELFEAQLNSSKYNVAVKQYIAQLKEYLADMNPEFFIRTFLNKFRMDEFLHLGKLQYNKDNNKHQPSGNSKIQVTQCQDHIEKLMKLTRKTKKIQTIIKNNESKQNFKQYIIEKEILHSDHLIMLIVKKYCDLIVNNYQINEDSLKVATEDHKQLLQFFTKFQIKMISEIYNCENIDSDLAFKTIFQNANIYHHYLAFITQLHRDEIRIFEQNLKSKEGITIKDLGAKEIFHVPENQEIYHHVIEQLNLIIEAKCPVKKFELIGKLKPIIIKSLDDYHQQQYQIEVDSDTFLIILIYSLIKQNKPQIFIHVKFISFTMSNQIEIDRGSHSWIFVSLIAAITHISEEKQMTGNSLQKCLQSVIESQIYLE